MGLRSDFYNFAKSGYTRFGEQIASEIGIDQSLKSFHNGVMLQFSTQEIEVEINSSLIKFQTPGNVYYDQLEYNLKTEEELIKDLLSNSQSDDVFFDIGANIGVYTCIFARLNFQSEIFSFEPIKARRKVLKRNISINNINAKTFGFALFDGYETPSWIDDNGGQVDFRQGDRLVQKHGVKLPNILKIDVEGGELSVLRGLKETISREECRHIYCEIHKAGNENKGTHGLTSDEIDDLYALLTDSGFDINHLYSRGNNQAQEYIRADDI